MCNEELWRFSSFDPIRRRWVRARYVCALHRIGLDGRPFKLHPPPEVREGAGQVEGLAFSPWKSDWTKCIHLDTIYRV